MTAVTWLHLSDWHQKGKDFDRKVVLRALIKDIKERKEISSDLGKIDFVIFSGDVAFGGKTEEYQAAKELFFQPILDACRLGPEQLFVVPGNHDMDQAKFDLLPAGLCEPLSTEKEVQDWLTDEGKRSRVLEPFKEFSSFVKEYTKQEPQDYANIKRIPLIDDREMVLLGINSAWMCGRNKGKTGDYGLAIIGEPQIFDALEEISGAALKIAVLHHPFNWLNEFDRNRIEDLLRQDFDFILHGHQHDPKVEITSGTAGDCVIIPAGASYDRRVAENPRYANSYNFVQFDPDTRKGAVYLRRWSDDGNRWLEDIASCKDGRCDLDLSKYKAIAPVETSAEIVSVPNQIPPPPLHFKGREQEIEDILSKFKKGATITGLRGMGGVGKTALALVLADKLKSRFPDGQIYIDMRGTSKNPDLPPLIAEEVMSHAIRSLKRIERLPENPVELRGLYNSTLVGKHVLLLLDNAKGSDQVYPLLPPEGCSVIITSRIKFELYSLVEKDLDTLHPKDSRELLLAIAPRIGDRADELAGLCGYLPLALRNAASALAEKKEMKVSEYERKLRDKVTRLELVKGSFSLSYDLLPNLRKKNWRRLSVFPEDFDQEAAIAVLKMNREASADALSELVRWSLVDYIPAACSEGGRYKLHDLARDFAESYLTQDELIDIQQRHANHYMNVLSQAGDLYMKGGMDLLKGLNLFDLEWANIKAGQAWSNSSIRSEILGKKDLQLAANLAFSYADKGGHILRLRLHPRDRISWFEAELDAARKMEYLGAEEVALGNLGLNYLDLGEPRKAIEFCEKALAISRDIGDLRNEGINLGNLGIAYSNLDEPRKAIEFHEQALAIARKIGDRRGEGINLGDLGVDYSNLDEPSKAIEFREQALAIAREIGDQRSEGIHLGNLGNAYSDLGEPRKAIEFYEQALKISREIGDRRVEGNHLGNLGNAYSNLGEPRKAIEFYEQALKISREIGDRRGEGSHLGNLGIAYSDLGEPRKAIEFYEQALKISREIGDQRGEGKRLGNLGVAYSNLGEPRKAIEFYEQALKIAQKIGTLRGEGNALTSLGSAYSDLGEPRKAIKFHEQALKISRQIRDRRSEGIQLGNLGNTHSDLGEPRKAIEFSEQALAIAREIGDRLGEGIQLGNLGSACSNLGETRKAIEFHEQALKISREIGDRRGEGYRLGNLGLAYSNLGETNKAIEFYEQAIAIVQEITDRQNESEILCNLGKAYLDTKETNRTIEYCTKSLDIARNIEYKKFEGEALCTLGKAFTAQGDLPKALDHCDQALKIFKDIEYPKGEAEVLFARSQVLHKLERPDEATQCAQKALLIFQRIESLLAEKVRQQLADWSSSPQET